MTVLVQLFVQIILILINAFFAGSEIALLSVNKAKLMKLDEEHDKTASKLLKLVEEPSGFLSTIQIGITLAGFLGSAFASTSFSVYIVNWIYEDLGFTWLNVSVLSTVSTIVVTLILSYFTLVFGELVPKRIAMQKSYEFSRMCCSVIYFISRIMKPFVWGLSASVNGVLTLFHLNNEDEEETVSEEEIRLMIDLGGQKGVIEADEQEWIENVFEFNETSVKEVMTPINHVTSISLDDCDEEILNIIESSGFSRFPVSEEDSSDIVGILYARDYLFEKTRSSQPSVKALMRKATFVPETLRIDDMFKKLQKLKIHIAIVIDEYGQVSGIVTMEDLLEEIVGNIYDEFDKNYEEEIVQIDENTYRIAGSVLVEDAEKKLGVEISNSEEYDTIGGFIFSCLDEIPMDQSVMDLSFDDFDIHVDRILDHSVQSCLVRVKK